MTVTTLYPAADGDRIEWVSARIYGDHWHDAKDGIIAGQDLSGSGPFNVAGDADLYTFDAPTGVGGILNVTFRVTTNWQDDSPAVMTVGLLLKNDGTETDGGTLSTASVAGESTLSWSFDTDPTNGGAQWTVDRLVGQYGIYLGQPTSDNRFSWYGLRMEVTTSVRDIYLFQNVTPSVGIAYMPVYSWNEITQAWDADGCRVLFPDGTGGTEWTYNIWNTTGFGEMQTPDIITTPDGKQWAAGNLTTSQGGATKRDAIATLDNSTGELVMRMQAVGDATYPVGWGKVAMTGIVPDGAGGYYSNYLDAVYHWDGVSSDFQIASTGADNGEFFFTSARHALTDWTIPGGAIPVYLSDAGSGTLVGSLEFDAGYPFIHNGYLYFLCPDAYLYTKFITSGAHYRATNPCAVLMRSTMPTPSTSLTPTYLAGLSEIVAIFTSEHTPYNLSGQTIDESLPQIEKRVSASPPTAWNGGYLLCPQTGTLYLSGVTNTLTTSDDWTFVHFLDASGNIYAALDLAFASPDNSAIGGAVYYHTPTSTLYAFYVSGTDMLYQSGDPSAPGPPRNRLHVMRLDSFTAPSTFAWTEVAYYDHTVVTGSRWSGSINVTSTDTQLFIWWITSTTSQVHRLNLSTYAWTVDTVSGAAGDVVNVLVKMGTAVITRIRRMMWGGIVG